MSTAVNERRRGRRALAMWAVAVVACMVAAEACHKGDSPQDPNATCCADVDAAPVEPLCPEACDLVEQAGCAAGEKCAYILDEVFAQRMHVGCATDGDVAVGERCIGPSEIGGADECAAGGTCFNNVCRAVCAESGSCAGDRGAQCTDLVRDPCDGAGACFACDPILQDCPPDDACYLVASGLYCARVFNHGRPGDACATVNDCTLGSACRGDPRRCVRYCSLTECPPTRDDTGDVVTWSNACSGGEVRSGRECKRGESCVGIEDSDDVGVCEAL